MRQIQCTVEGMLLSLSVQLRPYIFFICAMCRLSTDVNHCFAVNSKHLMSYSLEKADVSFAGYLMHVDYHDY